MSRDRSIDVLRGLSIVIMFYAHILPYYIGSISFFKVERILCSIAAPIFLFLLGHNFSKVINFRKLLIRGFLILFLAIFIDGVIFLINPFYSFDILYLIGISVFILGIINHLSYKFKIIFSSFILIISIIYHFLGFYKFSIYERIIGSQIDLIGSISNMFFNGWFPIFPWIIFPVFGNLVKNYNFIKDLKNWTFLPLTVLSGFFLYNNIYPLRSFSVEVFYPPNLIFIVFSFCVIIFIWKIKSLLDNSMFNFLAQMGRVSLLLYIVHLSTFHLVFSNISIEKFNRLLMLLISVVTFTLFAFLINHFKKKYSNYTKYEVLILLLGK